MKEEDFDELSTLFKSNVKKSFFGRSTFPKLKQEKTWKYFQVNLFEGTKCRIWIYIDKFENKKIHFCMILGGLITLDTAHIGKRIYGRLHLTRLLGKDFLVYSSSDSEVTENSI